MGVPSKKTPKNKTRTRNNAANKSIDLKEVGVCSKCKNPKIQHNACKFCGTYK